MKTTLFLLVLIFGISIGNSQNITKKEKAICVIENISSDSNYGLAEETNIEYNQKTGDFKITETHYLNGKKSFKNETFFNVRDIKTDNLIYKLNPIDGEYYVFVVFRAKENSVKSVITKDDDITTNYLSRILFTNGSKLLSKKIIMEYVENWKIIFEAKKLINVTDD